MEIVKKVRSVRLKDKDLELFDFIAKFGFATVDQLHSLLGGSLNSLKTRLSHLVNDSYLVNHRIFFSQPSVYTVTAKSNRTELGLVKSVNIRNYEHDIIVINVFLALRGRFIRYATEKMIRANRGIGVGKSGRLPDLVGYTADGRAIAIEVDRTDKSLDRLKSMVVSYATDYEYDEVWIICCNQLIFNNFEKVGFDDKIKLYHLKDVLEGKDLVYDRKAFLTSNPSHIGEMKGKYETEALSVENSQELKETTKEQVIFEEEKPIVAEEKKGKFFGNFRF